MPFHAPPPLRPLHINPCTLWCNEVALTQALLCWHRHVCDGMFAIVYLSPGMWPGQSNTIGVDKVPPITQQCCVVRFGLLPLCGMWLHPPLVETRLQFVGVISMHVMVAQRWPCPPVVEGDIAAPCLWHVGGWHSWYLPCPLQVQVSRPGAWPWGHVMGWPLALDTCWRTPSEDGHAPALLPKRHLKMF